jgi:hypothetical protein
MTHWPLVVLAAALAWAASDARAINKCIDKKGQVTYQETRCPDDAKANELKDPPPPGDSGPVPLKDDPEDPHMLDLVSVMVGYEGCTKASPDFATIHAAQYEAWRTGNAKYFARLEQSPRYQQVLANGRKSNAAQPLDSPEFAEKYARFCNVQFIPMLMRNTPR